MRGSGRQCCGRRLVETKEELRRVVRVAKDTNGKRYSSSHSVEAHARTTKSAFFIPASIHSPGRSSTAQKQTRNTGNERVG